MSIITNNLPELATSIRQEHHLAEQHAMQAVNHAMEAGRLLIEAKALCSHGKWLSWLADNFEGSARTAQAYMRLYENRDALANTQSSAHLSIDGALKLLAEPKEAEPATKNDTVSHLPEIVIPVGSVGFCEWTDSQKNQLIFEVHSFLFPDEKTVGIRAVYGMAGPNENSGLYCEYDRRGVNATFFDVRKQAEKYRAPIEKMVIYEGSPVYWESLREMDSMDARKQ